ncbi:hypothetical protein [Aureimonas sp. AU4]|uniref:hypothetical protein n=1 Tax=Aureimonas sp. AU4 TaxID=1638163 RepID=UPI000782578A|nr:hypothetical protein [Aureimonas sp. AU4]
MPTTSVKLANRICRHLGLDEDAKQRLHRTFRNIVTREIVPGTVDPDDARGTIQLDDDAAATAVLLVPLADMAVDARGLREVSQALLRADHLTGEKEPPIERAIAATRAGKSVMLLVELRWVESSAVASRKVRLVIEGDAEAPEAKRIAKAWRDAFTLELARIEVPASTWLRMYLADDAA